MLWCLCRLDDSAQKDYKTYSIQQYKYIHEKLLAATDELLFYNWQKVKDMAAMDKARPNADNVKEAFLSIEDVQAALGRLCNLHKQPAQVALQVDGGAMVRTRSQAPPRMIPPPEAHCFKQKPMLGTWPERYIKIKDNGMGSMGLYVYANKGDANSRGSSIEDLKGCTTQKKREKFTFSVRPTLCLCSTPLH